MPTILHVGPSDSEGYTRFVTLEPVHGEVCADNGNQGVTTVGGHPITGPALDESFSVGEAGHTLVLDGQREFDLADPIKSVTFPDGSTWSPSGK